MSLFRASDPDDQHDVLASNLLFATLGLTLLFQMAGWIAQALDPHQTYLHAVHLSWLTVAGMLPFLLVRGGLYYAVRQGILAAKWLLTLGFAVLLYSTTYWQQDIVAGVDFARFNASSFVMLANNLLTLAALVLMFTKPQVAPNRT